MTLPFAALILDRDPYGYADILGLLQAWLQDAGGFLFVGLVAYFVITLLRPSQQNEDDRPLTGFMLVCLAAAILLYSGYIFLVITSRSADRLNIKPPPDPTGFVKTVTPKFSLLGYSHADLPTYVPPIVPQNYKGEPGQPIPQPYPWQALLLTAGGLMSTLGATAPFVRGMRKLRLRRAWAIALLTIKEVMRNKVFLALFLTLLAVLLFPFNWFIIPKPEHELRQQVSVVSIFFAAGLVLAALLLAAFSLPNDVKNQNIYTIVSKPVERFEIVLGRTLGYVALFTAVTAVTALVTVLSMAASNPSKESQEVTRKARVPVRGALKFQSRKGLNIEGIDVGREFNYRKYIGGDPRSSQRATYEFKSLPSSLKYGDANQAVPVEFTFDIYRLTKGDENKGVNVNVRVVSWQCEQLPPPVEQQQDGTWKWKDEAARQNYLKDAVAELKKVPPYSGMKAEDLDKVLTPSKAEIDLRNCEPGTPVWAAANTLAEKYGYFEYVGKEVYDFHPEKVYLPAGLFANALANQSAGGAYSSNAPRVKVYIHCTTPSQMLGMAEGDLFLIEREQSFEQNYLKSAFGLWCWLVLVIGLCVTLSTYLDAVVTLLCVLFLFGTAFFANFIHEQGQTIGKGSAGPFAALNQLLQAKQPTAQAEGTAAEKAAETLDIGTGWGFRRIINVLPDVHAYNWIDYVSDGFNIANEYLVLNLLVLLAYLFPWFLLGYYLIRGREVAA